MVQDNQLKRISISNLAYRPPPAQAQAQPAQAQAQAQELPPPPPPPPRKPPEPLLVDTGIGFVRVVIPSVKDVRFPTTPAAIPVAPLITLAAKFEPGILGRDILPPPADVVLAGTGFDTVPPMLRRYVGE